MKLPVLSTMSLVVVAACGGAAAPEPAAPRPAPKPAVRPVEATPVREPEPPPPPPPPMEWYASVRLAPVKGVRMAPVELALFQVEGESTRVRSLAPFGVKAGTYHLVVHEGSECGPKGNKAGAVGLELTQDQPLVATRKVAPSVDLESRAIALDGEGSIVGHALVLHGDKRGRLGNPVACGVVVAGAGGE